MYRIIGKGNSGISSSSIRCMAFRKGSKKTRIVWWNKRNILETFIMKDFFSKFKNSSKVFIIAEAGFKPAFTVDGNRLNSWDASCVFKKAGVTKNKWCTEIECFGRQCSLVIGDLWSKNQHNSLFWVKKGGVLPIVDGVHSPNQSGEPPWDT